MLNDCQDKADFKFLVLAPSVSHLPVVRRHLLGQSHWILRTRLQHMLGRNHCHPACCRTPISLSALHHLAASNACPTVVKLL